MPETTGLIIGSVVTLLIFSYLIGDNLLYRWALALLVVAGTWYALDVALHFIFFDWVNNIQGSDSMAMRLLHVRRRRRSSHLWSLVGDTGPPNAGHGHRNLPQRWGSRPA
jgi:predicted membrane protein